MGSSGQDNARVYASPSATTGGIINAVQPQTADAAPGTIDLISGSAYAQATSNTTGADIRLSPGIGRRFYTIVLNTGLSGTSGSIVGSPVA